MYFLCSNSIISRFSFNHSNGKVAKRDQENVGDENAKLEKNNKTTWKIQGYRRDKNKDVVRKKQQ